MGVRARSSLARSVSSGISRDDQVTRVGTYAVPLSAHMRNRVSIIAGFAVCDGNTLCSKLETPTRGKGRLA
jgi:hypothetical protein